MAKKKHTTEEVKPVNVFKCDACPDKSEMELAEFKEHLSTVHNTKAEDIKGKKQMLMHMDGAKWFSSTYKWTLENGLSFHQHVTLPRSKSDPMRYEH